MRDKSTLGWAPEIKFESLIASLPKLTRDQLKQIHVRIVGLLAMGRDNVSQGSNDESFCYDEYVSNRKRKGGRSIPFHVIYCTAAYKKSGFKDGVEAVSNYIDDNIKRPLTQPKRIKMMRHIARTCAEWVNARDLKLPPLSAFAYAMKCVDEVVEWAHPGYAEAGLLHILAEAQP